jgi:hypothetical protein
MGKLRERLAVNKERSHRFHMEGIHYQEVKQVEGKEQYCIEVSNRFAALEDLDAAVEIKWEYIKDSHIPLSKPIQA